jgi:hypothetical protein
VSFVIEVADVIKKKADAVMNRVGVYGSMNFGISDRAHMRRHGRPA